MGFLARRASLVVDRGDIGTFGLDEVDLGDELVRVAGEGYGAGVGAIFGGELIGRCQRVGLAVELGVAEGALDGLAVVGEEAFDPLVVEQPRAVNEFVEHAGW